ncbi:hypothetical protein [Nocardioides panaciterrulae]|uniref:Cyclic nucleotide-binding domain-containing protein n=1 Tax=Nocardioides panaciterrulae TaxID=661492 RepID=A0A7Y9E599_9ACTN|nr:hypothetical protein [Nocardioides panaciterrulae]NYD41400.1 hypothetical protein [Nocardioides panaciterrulae]
MGSRVAPLGVLLASGLAATLVLGGCSGGGDTTASAAGSATPSGSSGPADPGPASGPASGQASVAASPYLPVPDGVELTAQGSELQLGDDAVVAYRPRQGTIGALDLKVTGLERTTFARSFQGWQLDKATRATSPYFVHVTVRNVGDTDLGGKPVPLYIVDGHDTLIESSTFASSFKPCPSTPFPKKFGHGDTVKTCLVFLSPRHGDLTAVSFRPSQEFNPITWTGKIAEADAPASGKHHRSGKGSKRHGGSKQG